MFVHELSYVSASGSRCMGCAVIYPPLLLLQVPVYSIEDLQDEDGGHYKVIIELPGQSSLLPSSRAPPHQQQLEQRLPVQQVWAALPSHRWHTTPAAAASIQQLAGPTVLHEHRTG
jgi:hypothetical protein